MEDISKRILYGKPQPRFDLHVHTTASDGSCDPKKIITLAGEIGLRTIAITDHDTVSNVKQCVEYGKLCGIRVIPGIELSAEIKKGKLHILGLGIDVDNENIKSVTEMIRLAREERNMHIIDALNCHYKMSLTLEDVRRQSQGETIGKPHIAAAIVKAGHANSISEAFDKFLCSKKIDKIERKKLSEKSCIDLINNAGGIAVLAHPSSLKVADDTTYAKIRELKMYGLQGVEAYHSSHTTRQAETYKKMAEKNGLVVTCGSDFHGLDVNSENELGYGRNNNIPTYNENYLFDVLKAIDNQKQKYDDRDCTGR